MPEVGGGRDGALTSISDTLRRRATFCIAARGRKLPHCRCARSRRGMIADFLYVAGYLARIRSTTR